jgi:photosystem II stability/assembly factor-like uncharacterized protein
VVSTTENYEGVAYGNGRWVIVGGKGTILSSPDGVQWTAETNPAGTAKLNDVAFGGGKFVAIGSGNQVVLTSPDGHGWTQIPLKVGGGLEIIYDGTQFISSAAGGWLFKSPDGTAWEGLERIPTLYVDVGGLAYGNGTYVNVGYSRTGKPTDLWSSPDLSKWEFRDAQSSQHLLGVVFGLGQFVAVGYKGTLITSPDGVQWTLRDVPHTGFIWDICQGGPYLAAAAQWGRVLTSTDGANWTRRQTEGDDHLTDIAFGNGTFIAVGWNGQIVQSDPIVAEPSPGSSIVLSQPAAALDEVKFSFTGTVGETYQVQSTSDWVSWVPVTTVTCTTSPMKVSLPNQALRSRFYRVAKQ